MLTRLPSLIAVSALVLLASCAVEPDSETKPLGENVLSKEELQRARTDAVDFTAHIKPVLEAKCVMCHNGRALPGHLNLEFRNSEQSRYIVPGHPEKSPLVRNITSAHAGMSAMPAVGERLTRDELQIITKWIKEGADWPAGLGGVLRVPR